MLIKIKHIFKVLLKKIFLGNTRQVNSIYGVKAPKCQIINYQMSSVFPDKQTKDAIMNSLTGDIDVEKKDA